MSTYHESIVLIGKDLDHADNEFVDRMENVGIERVRMKGGAEGGVIDPQLPNMYPDGGRQFEFVGRFSAKSGLLRESFLNLPSENYWRGISDFERWKSGARQIMPFANNCHWYGNAVLRWLRNLDR